MHVEQAAVQIRDVAEQLFQIGRAVFAAFAEAFVEQAEQEITVERVELVLALFLLATVEAVAEVIGVAVEKALALDEIDEHQAVEHDGRIPFAVGHLADAVNEFEEGFAVRVEVAVERLGDALDVERGPGAPGHRDGGQLAFFLFFERNEEDLQFLKQRVAGLGAIEVVRAGREWAARFAAHPHPGLLGEVAGGEYDEMLEAGLGQGAVEFQPRGVIRQADRRRLRTARR